MTLSNSDNVPAAATPAGQRAARRARSARRKLVLVRAALRSLSAVAPPLAARAAMAVFRMPPRHQPWEREREILAAGRPTRLDARGRSVAGWAWGSGEPVLLVHGWGSTGGRLGSFVEPLVERGFSVFTFDAPGHGATGGRQSSLPEFVFSIEAAAAVCGEFAAIVAHSLGGAAATLAIDRGVRARRAVLLAPSSNPDGYTRQFARIVGIPEGIRERMEAGVERRFGIPWSAFDVLAAGRRLSVPALIIHDAADAEVPWSEGDALAQAWPGAALVTTQGLGHTRIVHDADVVRRAVAFLGEAVPAGAFARGFTPEVPRAWA